MSYINHLSSFEKEEFSKNIKNLRIIYGDSPIGDIFIAKYTIQYMIMTSVAFIFLFFLFLGVNYFIFNDSFYLLEKGYEAFNNINSPLGGTIADNLIGFVLFLSFLSFLFFLSTYISSKQKVEISEEQIKSFEKPILQLLTTKDILTNLEMLECSCGINKNIEKRRIDLIKKINLFLYK